MEVHTALAGNDIEFIPGVEEFDSYLEAGMRATILSVEEYPEEGLFKVTLSYKKFELHNMAFESIRYYDRYKNQHFTFRQLNGYDEEESYCVSSDFDFFKLLAEADIVKYAVN